MASFLRCFISERLTRKTSQLKLRRHQMLRNIFDQYEQPENRLTHALITLLDLERSLLVPFLRWLGIRDTPKPRTIQLTEQQVPGILKDESEDFGSKGLPDAAMFDETGWAVLFESKVQSRCDMEQIERH